MFNENWEKDGVESLNSMLQHFHLTVESFGNSSDGCIIPNVIVINKDVSKNYYDKKQEKNAITILEQNFHLKAPGFLNTRIP